MADFETTTDPDDCRVWLWGIADLADPDFMTWGTELEDFIDYVSQEDSVVYFHNLKFDGHFIMDYIMKHGYVHRSDNQRDIQPGEFRTLISHMNKWYSFTVRWRNGAKTEFRDSLKKINMPVSHIGPTFKLKNADGSDLLKGDIDYHAKRPRGYRPTADELDYLQRDLAIPAKALTMLIESGMKKLTVAADSLAEYKHLVGEKYFSRMFPVLPANMDAEIRKAYRGGFTYADKRFMKRKVGAGIVLDVNSLYPHIMYNRLLPYGEPEWVEGKVEPTERRPLTIFTVTFTAKLKPNHIPCIQIKGSAIFGSTEYLEEIPEATTLVVTNVDWELYNDHYDIQVLAYGGGWRFRADDTLFRAYIDKWMEVKANSEGGQREIAKLHLNSLYGKFASNPNVTGKIPVLEENRIRFVTGPEETKAPIYTAVGVFVTSWARDLTIRAAQSNYDVFAYADTDSLHLLTEKVPESIEVHPSKLGAWKFEYAFTEAWYVRAKAYLEKTAEGKYHVAWAGLPQKEQAKLTFDSLKDGAVIWGKLQPESVVGGVVLKDSPYTLKL